MSKRKKTITKKTKKATKTPKECKTCAVRVAVREHKQIVIVAVLILLVITAIILTQPKEKNLLCEKDGKPIIRMYSTSTCSHCAWVAPAFEEVAKKYESEGKIIAHHWKWIYKENEFLGVDDLLTPEFEGIIPEKEIKIFEEFNPRGAVPLFVFGCEETRLGTKYEQQNDLESEKKDFEKMIEKILAKQNK